MDLSFLTSRAAAAYLVAALFALLAAFHVVLPASVSQTAVVATVMLVGAAVTAIVRFTRSGDPDATAKAWYQSKTVWTALVAAAFSVLALIGVSPAIDQSSSVAAVMTVASLIAAYLHPTVTRPIAPVAG